jgi:6,7-dimethyl-8-ribityllumazine synthase
LQPKVHQGLLNAEGFRFAIIASRWNSFLTEKLVEGALDAFERLGADEKSIEIFKVPGSFELPLTAQKAAESGRFDASFAAKLRISITSRAKPPKERRRR